MITMFFILVPFFSKGLRISSSILRGMQKEGRRRVDVNHTSQLESFIHLSGSGSGSGSDSSFRLFHTPDCLELFTFWKDAFRSYCE